MLLKTSGSVQKKIVSLQAFFPKINALTDTFTVMKSWNAASAIINGKILFSEKSDCYPSSKFLINLKLSKIIYVKSCLLNRALTVGSLFKRTKAVIIWIARNANLSFVGVVWDNTNRTNMIQVQTNFAIWGNQQQVYFICTYSW